MAGLSSWLRRVRALVQPGSADSDMDEEFRVHLHYATQKNLEQGMGAEEARRHALLSFGGVEKFREETREARGLLWLEQLSRDLRFALRTLRKSRGFTAAAVLTLALGIGSTTAIFSAVHTVLLAPLPHPESDRLVRVYLENSPTNRWGPSAVDFRAIETQHRSFSAVGAVRRREAALNATGQPERARLGAATSGFFRALGVRLEQGRAISPEDEGAAAPAVVVLGHEMAVRAFGDAQAAVGRTVTVDGVAHSVVGVLPAGVRELAGIRAELWSALRIPPPERRGPFGMFVVGRLRDGVTLNGARRDLAGISERIFPEWAASFQDRTATLVPVLLHDAIVGRSGRTLWMFTGAIGLVLLIALTNVASLVLVRTTGRAREWALRGALGGSRRQLARQLVTESAVLTMLGALAGLPLAAVMLRLLARIGPNIPRLDQARLDLPTFGFALGLALLMGLVVGAYPVLSLFRGDFASGLRGGEREIGAGRGAGTVRGLLVSAEFALALPLLAGAALLLNSFLRLQEVDPGFDPGRLLTVSVSLPEARYSDSAAVIAFWQRAASRVAEVPGVLAIGVSTAIPPEMPANENNFDLLDRPVPTGSAQPVVPWPSVTPEFFAALGVPLLEGRGFTPADSGGAPPVVLVSRAWARRFSPDRSAIGRQLVSGGCTECPPTTIIGIVGDVKYGGLAGTSEAAYEPFAQGAWRDGSLIVRTAGPPAGTVEAVRRALGTIDSEIPLDDAGMLQERVYATAAQPRHWALLAGAFAVAALGLASVGIFGMLSYFVAARRREIGVRVALGALRGEVVAMVVRRGMAHAGVGALVGLVVALSGMWWMESALFQVSPRDPATLATVTLLLLLVALGACWVPARRAAAIDPMEVMRAD